MTEETSAEPEQPRAKSSLAQWVSAFTQLGVLAIAVYGIFLSDAGDRLFEVLRRDIESSESELRQVNERRAVAEVELREQQQRLSDAATRSLRTEIELALQRQLLSENQSSLEMAELQLGENLAELEGLHSALRVTRPALIRQRCTAAVQALRPVVGLDIRFRLLPLYRWNRFRAQVSRQDYESWESFESAFERFVEASYQTEDNAERNFRNADSSISRELSLARFWFRQNEQNPGSVRSSLVTESPRDFQFSPSGSESVRGSDDILDAYFSGDARRESIEYLLRPEPLEDIDQNYQEFKQSLRVAVEPYIPGYQARVSESESSAAEDQNEIFLTARKHLAYMQNARQALASVGQVCYRDDPLREFILDI